MATRANMHDVARLAGVSQRTVSNVVNDFVHVAPATRDRVQQAIAALQYRPHVTAQRLRGGRTGILALAVPEITGPYFSEIADLIQRRAHAAGVTLLIDQTGGTREQETLVLAGYRSTVIDGLILSPIALGAVDIEQHDVDVPIVLLGEQGDSSELLHVSIDNVAAAGEATEHLLGLGRRRIAVVGAPSADTRIAAALRRYRGYQEAMGRAGLPVAPDLVNETSSWTRASGYEIAGHLAAMSPAIDAVFCFNDPLAVGILKRFGELGVRVPADIAVLGWDDTEDTLYTTPTLTSVSPDKEAIAATAISGVLARPGTISTESPTIGYHLVVRQSTAG